MSCDNCFWKQRFRIERCGMKGIYLYSSVIKHEEGKFCNNYKPLYRGKYTADNIASMTFREKLENGFL